MVNTTTDSADIPESDIKYGYMVYTMGDDVLEAMELKMVNSVMTLIVDLGRNVKWMMTLTLFLTPFKITVDIKCTYGYLNQLITNISYRE